MLLEKIATIIFFAFVISLLIIVKLEDFMGS
jgi:hypothetical protein